MTIGLGVATKKRLRTGATGGRGLEKITNGTFSTNATGWNFGSATHAVIGGELELNATVSGGRAEQEIVLTAGRVYEVSASLRCGTTTGVRVGVIRGAGGGYGGVANSTTYGSTSPGNVLFTFTAPGADAIVQLICSTTGVGYFDNVSVREVL